MGDLDDLADLAAQLYALPLEEFVAARSALAKQARADGDRQLARLVGELPKPTVAAWLLNQLVRRRPQEVGQLVELGDQLREAQRTLAGDQLRALTRQRHAVVTAFARQVATLADELDRSLSATVAEQVEETLRAAVADADAGRALLRGRLTTALSYVGMGDVDISSAVVLPFVRRGQPAPPPEDEPDQGDEEDEAAMSRARRYDAARKALDDAQDEARRATQTLDEHGQLVRRVEAESAQLRTHLEALQAELAEVTEQATETEARLQEAQAARDGAREAAAETRAALQHAEAELAELA